MERETHELEPPPDVRENGGYEVLRAFVSDGALSVALRRSFEDPSVWGRMLADLARQAAQVYQKETGLDEYEAREEIRAAFERAMDEAAPGGASSVN